VYSCNDLTNNDLRLVWLKKNDRENKLEKTWMLTWRKWNMVRVWDNGLHDNAFGTSTMTEWSRREREWQITDSDMKRREREEVPGFGQPGR